MGRMIKLSKQDWMRIGMEQGFMKEADIGVPVVHSLRLRLEEIVAKLDRMGPEDLRYPELESAAQQLHGDLNRFESLLRPIPRRPQPL